MCFYISDGLLGLLLCIPCFLNSVIHFTLDLDQISLKLLLSVHKACVLKCNNIRYIKSSHDPMLFKN